MMETSKDAVEGDVPEDPELMESPQLHILRAKIESVISKSTRSLSLQRLIEIVQNNSGNASLTKEQEKSLNRTFSQVKRILEDIVMKDIDNHFQESGFHAALFKISRLIPETSTCPSMLSWRPSGVPQQDMKSHEAENIIQYNRVLEELIQKQEAEIQGLKHTISNRRLGLLNFSEKLSDLKNNVLAVGYHNRALLTSVGDVSKVLNK